MSNLEKSSIFDCRKYSDNFNYNKIIATNSREVMLVEPGDSGVETLLAIMTDSKIRKCVKILLERFQLKYKTIRFSKDITEGTIKFEFNSMPLTYERFLYDISNSLSMACKSSSVQNTDKIKHYFKECLNENSVLYNLVSIDNLLNSELFTNTLEKVYLTVKNTMPEDMAKRNSIIFLKELCKTLKVEMKKFREINDYYEKLNNKINSILNNFIDETEIPIIKFNNLVESENDIKYKLLDELVTVVNFNLPFNEHTKEWYNFNTDLVFKYLRINRYDIDSLENKTITAIIKRGRVPVVAILPIGTNMSLSSVDSIYQEVLKLNVDNTLIIHTLMNSLDTNTDIECKMNLYMRGYDKECVYLYTNNRERLMNYKPELGIKRLFNLLNNYYDYSKETIINKEKLETLSKDMNLQQVNQALKLNIGKKPSEYDYKILLDRFKCGLPYSSGENAKMYYNCNEVVFDFSTLMYSTLNKYKNDLINCIETDDKEYINFVLNINKIMIFFNNGILKEYYNRKGYNFEDLIDTILYIINNRDKFYATLYSSLLKALVI